MTSRLKDSPAIISSHESGALRRMMRMVEQQNSGEAPAMPKQKIEINPRCRVVSPREECREGVDSIAPWMGNWSLVEERGTWSSGELPCGSRARVNHGH